jgi:hypothetical protein
VRERERGMERERDRERKREGDRVAEGRRGEMERDIICTSNTMLIEVCSPQHSYEMLLTVVYFRSAGRARVARADRLPRGAWTPGGERTAGLPRAARGGATRASGTARATRDANQTYVHKLNRCLQTILEHD